MADYSVGILAASVVVRLWLLHSSKAKCLWNALQARQHIQKIVARRDHYRFYYENAVCSGQNAK